MNPDNDNVKDTSEPAFPALAHWDRHSRMSTALQFSGMSLRDHFAGRAMQGLITQNDSLLWEESGIAEAAYRQADAMLKARAR